MAATKSAKNPTARNDTPDTPDVREGAIAKMKVAELRRKLRTHGVENTADLKKPELVKKLIRADVSATKARKSTTKKSTAKNAKNPTSGNDTPNTPDVSESAIAAMKVDGLRRRLRSHGVTDTADLKKPELVKKLIKAEVSATKARKSTTKKSTAKNAKNPTSGNDTPNTP
ncbi:HeH/LEM domain-containing protein, partial [Actinoplanes sp. NPDC048967]|uniref:HeH/LEM domain-containing protein n=1 Tax=Actinoplanes sp. NPDC048967 TaxID=3155269 RepID=UPI0033E70DA5